MRCAVLGFESMPSLGELVSYRRDAVTVECFRYLQPYSPPLWTQTSLTATVEHPPQRLGARLISSAAPCATTRWCASDTKATSNTVSTQDLLKGVRLSKGVALGVT